MSSWPRDEWFRSPAWDEQIEAAFEERLRRARPYNQPQYIRIQATHLLSSPDPRVREAGRGLLRRVDHYVPRWLRSQHGDGAARRQPGR